MSCIDTDTALSVVQALGPEADLTIAHLATCPACASTLADVSALHQTFKAGTALTEDAAQDILEAIQAAPVPLDPQSMEPSPNRPVIAGATFLLSVLTVLGLTMFPGMGILLSHAEAPSGFLARLFIAIVIAKYATWPELFRGFTHARVWQMKLQRR